MRDEPKTTSDTFAATFTVHESFRSHSRLRFEKPRHATTQAMPLARTTMSRPRACPER
ncbi:hypothetical protein AB395_00002608 [Sinorhizobium fredii CCBAU 45436]|nr:hypothetical protein SF83666_c26400 [Sinorhizobium fredii CCBAU 83666]AWI58259.1 hypothetical protein AB395_00002608 [Sinorhizobium fredii CCBAU 45436]AWM26101.1 hypothetical protein AOX55_00002852 [Sinorhizobium fredii CCBAU 25509]